MKKLLTALVVLLPFVATAQYEPVPSDGGYAPTAPSSRRSPWYIGFGLGTGNGSLTDTLGDNTFEEWNSYVQTVSVTPTNVTLNFKVGATVSPNLLVGFDITAIRSSAYDQGWTTAVQVTNYDGVVTWFPQGEGLFVRGGAGLSAVSFSLDTPTGSASDGYSGFNVLAGAGYALWIGQAFNLTFNIDYSLQSYGSGTAEYDGSRFWNLWLGFDWY
jgi:hypothetical protein